MITNHKIGICIVTYNEEKYIRQCVESALAQVCSEPYTVYIGEDCSTDGTLAICEALAEANPSKVVLVHREINLGLVKNTIELLRQIRGDGCEYVAMLDGDDYWIDDKKLEKQVSFLKEHPDYGLVHTNIHILRDDRWFEIHRRSGVVSGYLFDVGEYPEIAAANCSVMFRTALLNHLDLDDFMKFGLKSVDYAMYHLFLKYTKIQFLGDFTAVWRRGHQSVSNKNNTEKQIAYCWNGVQSWRMMNHYFPEKWPVNEDSFKEFVNMQGLKIAFRNRDYKICRHCTESPYYKPKSKSDKMEAFSTKNPFLFFIVSTVWKAKDKLLMVHNHLRYLKYDRHRIQ